MLENLLEAIGRTPLVKINRLNPNPRVTMAVKLEGANPGGSVKDRIAYYMITMAENRRANQGQNNTGAYQRKYRYRAGNGCRSERHACW